MPSSSPSQDLTFSLSDLEHILEQIEIAELHTLLSPEGDCSVLLNILPNATSPLGLRSVDGSCNNLLPEQENFGAADVSFNFEVPREYQDADAGTSYGSDTHVVDNSPRMISQLIVNQSTDNPAAEATMTEEGGETIGPDITAADQFFIPNTAPDEGLSAPMNAFTTFFGQFFDHGLDLINKGGNGMVMMPIPVDDPLFDASCVDGAGPPCNIMMLSRATQTLDAAGNRTFVNKTTPHVDQQQTYASHASAQMVLREYKIQDTEILTEVTNIGDWMDGDISGYEHIAPEGDSRALIAMVHAEDNGPAGDVTNFTSVTYGGQPLTQVVEQLQHQNGGNNGFSAVSEIWILDEEGLLNATDGNLVATTTGGNGAGEAKRMSSLFVSGVDQDDPIGQIGTDGENANNTQTLSVTVSGGELDAGDMVIANTTVRNDQNGNTSFAYENGLTATGVYSPTPNSSGSFLTYSDAQTLADGDLEIASTVQIQNNGVGALAFMVLNHAALTSSSSLQHTGYLLTGSQGGMSTWEDVRNQARDLMGIDLDDQDGNNFPLFLTDSYGNYTPGLKGLPQMVTEDGSPVEGDVDSPIDGSQGSRIGQSFFIDVAHSAAPNGTPDADMVINERTDMLSGQETRGIRKSADHGEYDDELLDVHFMCGDGRCNENIALTTIHHIFHSEHNRLVDVVKRVLIDSGELETLNNWLDTPVTDAPVLVLSFPVTDASPANQDAAKAAIDALELDWNGERLFQAARFGTEMQYNRVVFDEFSPTLAGLKDVFEGYHTDVDPTITAEFSQSVYRFGHSMLTDTVDRYDKDFNTITDAGALNPDTASDQLGLVEAFLNPLAFYNSDADGNPTMTPNAAAGSIIRGLTRTVANEIDEFVTGALQNNLVGLALDLGAINIARGRDVGNPKLNDARRDFYDESASEQLTPYNSWMDYGDNLRHEASLVNFIAAYGTHDSITLEDTYDGKRGAACAIVGELTGDASTYCMDNGWWSDGTYPTPIDALDFLYSQGQYTNNADGRTTTGVDDIDFWVGGLAEERMPFGGYLGSTHNYVFENQIESLQNGDRFYYVGRTKGTGMDLFSELESNSFTALAMRNSDMGEQGAGPLPFDLFKAQNNYMEVDQTQQFNTDLGSADPVGESELFSFWIRNPELSTTNINVLDPALFLQTTGGDHYTINGTEGNDTMIGGIGDDSIWGRGGNDRIEGGDGADHIEGGPGDDIITDLSGPDVIEGGPGNDAIASGNEADVVFGDDGSDFIVNWSEEGEVFGGPGNDFALDGPHISKYILGAGNDWLEELGGGENIHCMDNCAVPEGGEPGIKGHDVMVAWGGNNDMDMENGDDIMVNGPGTDRMEGQLGFDWASFQNDTQGVNIDLDLTAFMRPILPPSNATILNRYDRVEGLSGSPFGDILRGTSNDPGLSKGNELVNFDLIAGLSSMVPVEERRDLPNDPVTNEPQFGWTGGDIILGGGGSDLLVGEGGDDIIDGDSDLRVGINSPNPAIRAGGHLFEAQETAEASSAAAATAATAATDAATAATNAATAATGAATAATGAATAATNAATDAATNAATAATNAATAATDAATAATDAEAADADAATAATDAATAATDAATAATDAATAATDAATAATDAATAATDAATADADAATAATDAATAATDAEAAAAEQAATMNMLIEDLAALGGEPMDPAILAPLFAAVQASTDANTAAATATANAEAADADAATAATDAATAATDAATAATDAATAATDAATAATDAATAATDAATAATDAEAAAADAEAAAADAATAATDAATAATDAEAADADAATAATDAEAADADAEAAATNAEAADADAATAATDAATAAQAAAAAVTASANAPDPVVVDSMQDIMGSVFGGKINPGELSISRSISDADQMDGDTDSALYSGNREDYVIESDASGIFDVNGDGYIEVLDTRLLIPNVPADKNTNEGRDLLKNTERLVFADTTIVISPGVAGAGNSSNSVAVGRPMILGVPEVESILTCDHSGVTDADNVSADPVGSVDSALVETIWEVELAIGSNFFSPISRLEGFAGNGDAFPVLGKSMVLTEAEAGLQVRCRTIFKDEENVFEIVTSPEVVVGGATAAAAGKFMGTVTDIDGLTPTYIVGEDNIKAIISDFDTDLLDAFPEDFDENSTYDVHGIVLTYTTISVGMEGEIIIFENSLDNAEAVVTSNDDGSEYTVDLIYTLDGAAYSDTGNGLTLATLTGMEGDPMTAPLSEIFYDQEVLTTLTEIESAIDDLLTKAFSVVEDDMVEEAVIEEMTIASATVTGELEDDGVML